MKISEPILNDEDRRIWRQLQRTVGLHVKTRKFANVVEKSREVICQALFMIDEMKLISRVAWSAGKDSTAMVALIADVCRICSREPIRAMSIKDDLDFPGEEKYLNEVATKIGVEVDIVHPKHSLQEWVLNIRDKIAPGDDIHGRSSGLSKNGFYSVIEKHDIQNNVMCTFLGLRKDESRGRLLNRASRGPIYRLHSGKVIVQPICDWSGLDVFAFLKEKEIEPLPLYRCVRMHREPWRVRKSWWLPGEAACRGQGVWLRTYYPSLFNRMTELLPHHRCLS